jgi:hypothetical protein
LFLFPHPKRRKHSEFNFYPVASSASNLSSQICEEFEYNIEKDGPKKFKFTKAALRFLMENKIIEEKGNDYFQWVKDRIIYWEKNKKVRKFDRFQALKREKIVGKVELSFETKKRKGNFDVKEKGKEKKVLGFVSKISSFFSPFSMKKDGAKACDVIDSTS